MTKGNKIQEVKQAIEKVAEKKSYKLGDEVKAYGKNCKIVEVLEPNRFHVKNLDSPSAIIFLSIRKPYLIH